MNSIHELSVRGINGETIQLSQFRGKKLMIVNIASACLYTPQLAELQELYEQFWDRLTILACPSNDFGGQMPLDGHDIKDFCENQFKVTFPITEKINIIGKDKHPIYRWLTSDEINGIEDSKVDWNFQKYLLDEEGRYEAVLSPGTSPIGESTLAWLGV